jgi:Outer membrane efflux protein
MPPANSPTAKETCRVQPYPQLRSEATSRTSALLPEYDAVDTNVGIPIFNGHSFSARREAAEQRALDADQRLRDDLQRISRDARLAWASANNSYHRIDVTAQFLQATLALQLAQALRSEPGAAATAIRMNAQRPA